MDDFESIANEAEAILLGYDGELSREEKKITFTSMNKLKTHTHSEVDGKAGPWKEITENVLCTVKVKELRTGVVYMDFDESTCSIIGGASMPFDKDSMVRFLERYNFTKKQIHDASERFQQLTLF